jgi:hypothetical protein
MREPLLARKASSTRSLRSPRSRSSLRLWSLLFSRNSLSSVFRWSLSSLSCCFSAWSCSSVVVLRVSFSDSCQPGLSRSELSSNTSNRPLHCKQYLNHHLIYWTSQNQSHWDHLKKNIFCYHQNYQPTRLILWGISSQTSQSTKKLIREIVSAALKAWCIKAHLPLSFCPTSKL